MSIRDAADNPPSLALGVKMNILLFLPGLLVILFQYRGFFGVVDSTVIFACVQVGLPGIYFFDDKQQLKIYFLSAFDFGRQFLYEWTVNWKFLSEDKFLSPTFAKILLGAHAATLVAFGLWRWCPVPGGTVATLGRGLRNLRALFQPAIPITQLSSERKSARQPSQFDSTADNIPRHPPRPLHLQPDRHDVRAQPSLPVPRMVLPPAAHAAVLWSWKRRPQRAARLHDPSRARMGHLPRHARQLAYFAPRPPRHDRWTVAHGSQAQARSGQERLSLKLTPKKKQQVACLLLDMGMRMQLVFVLTRQDKAARH